MDVEHDLQECRRLALRAEEFISELERAPSVTLEQASSAESAALDVVKRVSAVLLSVQSSPPTKREALKRCVIY